MTKKNARINWFNCFGSQATGPEADDLRRELSEVLASSNLLMPEIEECKTFSLKCGHCGWPGKKEVMVETPSVKEASMEAIQRHDMAQQVFAPHLRCTGDTISISHRQNILAHPTIVLSHQFIPQHPILGAFLFFTSYLLTKLLKYAIIFKEPLLNSLLQRNFQISRQNF